MEQGDLRKRTAVAASSASSTVGEISSTIPDQEQGQKHNGVRRKAVRRNGYSFTGILFVTFLLFGILASFHLLSKLYFLRLVTLIPIMCSAYTGIQNRHNISRSIVPLTLVATVICAQLPSAFATATAVTMVVLFSWVTDPNGAGEVPSSSAGSMGFTTAAMAIVAMIAVLLTENFLIWVVSATFEAGQNPATEPPPLQDNGQLILKNLIFSGLSKREVVGLRRMWNTQWSLVACMAVALFVVQVYKNRTLLGVATRALNTIAIARTIRTVSFLLTVLPSQVKNCYFQRFPAVPQELVPWIMVGLQPRSHGGCNDLIISGHAVITSTLACVATSVADNRTFTFALFSLLTMDFAVEVYEGFHYSCDMWLGMVLVVLLWKILQPIEGAPGRSIIETPSDVGNKFARLKLSGTLVYIPPAIVAYLQLNLLPEASANFTIIAFVIIAATLYLFFVHRQMNEERKRFFMHYVQHMALCLMTLAFGIYL